MQIHRVLSIKYSTQGDHVLSPAPRSTCAYLLLAGTYLTRQKENTARNPPPLPESPGSHPLLLADRCFTSGRLSSAVIITLPSGARLTSVAAFAMPEICRMRVNASGDSTIDNPAAISPFASKSSIDRSSKENSPEGSVALTS